jgi:fatty-acyl-CoA synthase
LTFGGFLDEVRNKFASRPALISAPPGGPRTQWTYDELRSQARRVAKALIAGGVSRGTRVAVLMGGRPEWIAATWGAAMAGGVGVLLSTFSTPRELDHLLRHSDTSVVLTETAFLRRTFVDEILGLCSEARTARPGAIRSATYPFLRRIVAIDADPKGAVECWETFLATAAEVPDAVLDGILQETVPSEDGLVIYSSGTTSLPKGVLHRHRGPMRKCWHHTYKEQLTPEDRVYNGLPLFWTAGFAAVLGATLGSGAALVVAPYFAASDALRLIEEEKITIVLTLDNQAEEMRAVQQREPRDLSSVRRYAERFIGETPPDMPRMLNRASYGSSETFTSITSVLPDCPLEERATYGHPTAGASMRILDLESGVPLGRGQAGEIILKGITLMRGYVKVAPEETFDEEGYFHTGDLGWFDDHELLHFEGRITSMIKTSGANVAPAEVEEVIKTHPGVKEAAVVGVPDPLSGEAVVACVVPEPDANLDEEQLHEYLVDKLSSFKIPRRFLFTSEDQLARTHSERFHLPAVRALASRLLSSGE